MKERIVITQDWLVKDMKAGVPELDKLFICQKIEQVPENWEELKELCKGITLDLKICKDGTIYCYEYLLAKNRTPQQMWQIIKSLIGEK
jgi:hypothetical protein